VVLVEEMQADHKALVDQMQELLDKEILADQELLLDHLMGLVEVVAAPVDLVEMHQILSVVLVV
jgi:hypothetical protein